MPQLKIVVGLTDQFDEESMHQGTLREASDDHIDYNLYQLNPNIEKETITWLIETDTQAVLNAVDATEDLIRKPHLKMITVDKSESRYAPQFSNYIMNLKFLSLMPFAESYKEMTADDFANAHLVSQFGTMYFNIYETYEVNAADYEATLIGRYNTRTSNDDPVTGNIETDIMPVAAPVFQVNFTLSPQYTTPEQAEKLERTKFEEWVRNNTELDVNSLPPVGRIPFAKLIDDPWETYNKFSKNPYVCRISIVKEE